MILYKKINFENEYIAKSIFPKIKFYIKKIYFRFFI